MDSSPSVKRAWVLTPEAFARFLTSLDPDPERAGEKYEEVRRMLVKFFECRRLPFPEELADEAFNRVARKLDEGVEVGDFTGYCYGVARFLSLETLKRPESRREALDELPPMAAVRDDSGDEARQLACFEKCLRLLPPASQEVIVQYYQGEKREMIDRRKELAARLGIPLNALRSRAQRIREKLEDCVKQCLKE